MKHIVFRLLVSAAREGYSPYLDEILRSGTDRDKVQQIISRAGQLSDAFVLRFGHCIHWGDYILNGGEWALDQYMRFVFNLGGEWTPTGLQHTRIDNRKETTGDEAGI